MEEVVLAGTTFCRIDKRKRKTTVSSSTLEELPIKKQKKLPSNHRSRIEAIWHRHRERAQSPPSLTPEPSVPLPKDDAVRIARRIEPAPLAAVKPYPRSSRIADVERGKSSYETPYASPKALVAPDNFEAKVPSSVCKAFVGVGGIKPSCRGARSASTGLNEPLKPSSLQTSQSHRHGEGSTSGKDVRKTKVVRALCTSVTLTTQSTNEDQLVASSSKKESPSLAQHQDIQTAAQDRRSNEKSPIPAPSHRRAATFFIFCLALLLVFFPHRIWLNNYWPSGIDGYGGDRSDSLEENPKSATHAIDRVKEVRGSLKKSEDANQKFAERIKSLREQLAHSQELLDFSHSTASLQRGEISKMHIDIAELKSEKERGDEERLQALRELEALQMEWKKREANLLLEIDKERQSASKLASNWEKTSQGDLDRKQQLERQLAAEKKESLDYRGKASREISDFKNTIAQLEQAVAKNSSVICTLRKELEGTFDELQILKKVSQEEISELQAALAARVGEVEQQKLAVERISLQLAESKEAHIALKTQRNEMQLALNETLLELQEVQKSLEASRTSCDAQVVQIKSAHKKVVSRQSRGHLAKVNRVITEANNTLEEKDAKIAELLSNVAWMEESSKVVAEEKDGHIQSLEDRLTEGYNQKLAAVTETKQKCEAAAAAVYIRNEFILQERAGQIRQLHATCAEKEVELDSRYRDASNLRGLHAASEERVFALKKDLHKLRETLRKTKVLHSDELRSVKDMAAEEMSGVSSKCDKLLKEKRKELQDLTIAFADKDALVRELRIQSESQDEMMLSLEAEIDVRKNEVQDLAANMEAASSTQVAVARERDEVLEELSQLRRENEVLLKAGAKTSEELFAKVHNLKVEKDKVEKALDALRVTAWAMSLVAEKSEATINGKFGQIHNLQVQLNEAHAELEDLNRTVEAVEAERRNVLGTSKKEVSALKQELLNLSGINESLLLEIDAMRKQSDFKDGQLRDKKNTIATLNASIEGFRKTINQSYRLHAEDLQNCEEQAREEVARTAERLEEKIEKLINNVDTMKSDLNSKERQIQKQNVAATALIDKLASFEERATNLVAKLEHTTQECSEARGLCKEEIASLRAKIGSQVTELRTAERELECTREKEGGVERRLNEFIDMLDEPVRMEEEDSEKWERSHSIAVCQKQGGEERSNRFRTSANEMEELELFKDFQLKQVTTADFTFGAITTNQEAAISADLDNTTLKEPVAKIGYYPKCIKGIGIFSIEARTSGFPAVVGDSMCSNAVVMSTGQREAEGNLIDEGDEKHPRSEQLACQTNLTKSQLRMIGKYCSKKLSNLSLGTKVKEKTCTLVCCETEATSSENTCTIDEEATFAMAFGFLRNAILKTKTRQQKADQLLEQAQSQLEETQRELNAMTRMAHDATLCLEEAYAACWLWRGNISEVQTKCSPLARDTVKRKKNPWWNALGNLVQEATEVMLQ